MKRGTKKPFFVQQAALFLTFLVLSIPFFSSQALALSITKATVAGSDGIEDVMKSDNDYFTATVKTSEEVDPDDIIISYTKEEAFDECTGTTCTYTSSQTDRAGQEMDYTIQLIEESAVADTVEGTLLIDEEEPTIEEYVVEQEGEDITITYEVTDTACAGCSGCSGIDTLTLFQDNTEIASINVPSECAVEDSYETTISELNIEDGDHELCMIAVDNVGYESDEACEAVTVDLEGPHFETGSLEIVDSISGNAVEYIGTDAVLVDIFINVSDATLNENTVAGDFSDLNAVIGDTYKNMTASSCEQDSEDEELYTCGWYGVYIEGVSGGIKIPFYAQDNGGNEGKYSPTYTLTKDDTAPAVVQVYGASGSEDIYFKSGTNSLYADLDATGSAFAFEQAYMTFGLASLSKKQATACWENNGYWSCVWNFSMSYSGTASSSVLIDAEDDAGNSMESYDVDVGTDSEEPEISSITTNLDCPTASDILEVTINATDDSDELLVTLYGEDVRTDNEPIIEECSEIGEGNFTCFISVKDLVSYPEEEDVTVEVTDLAGNVADDEVSVSVCELEEAGTPNLVTIYADDVGSVDRLTLSYMDYPLYIPLTFSMSSGAHIVSKTATCDNAENPYFIDQSETESFMVVSLPQQAVANTTLELPVTCIVSMTMQYGDNVYATPEQDEVEIDVPVYGLPLGGIEDAIVQHIEYQKMGIADAQKSINRWVWINRILGIICNLVNVWTKMNAMASVVHGIGATLMFTPADEVGYAISKAMTVIDKITLKFVWFPGYGGWTNVGTYSKWACTIYSGKLCEGYNGLINEFVVDAEEAGTRIYMNQNLTTSTGTTEFGRQQTRAEEAGKLLFFYDWDPYKSYYTAANCLYPEAIIYNLRKERQINCMYTTCLSENSQNGQPTDVCDVQYQERNCLYVQGAAWAAAGWGKYMQWLQLVLNSALSSLDVLVGSAIYYASCDAYLFTQVPEAFYLFPGSSFLFIGDFAPANPLGYSKEAYEALPTTQMYYAYCQSAESLLTLTETNWFTKSLDWDFQANLEGTDYCEGYG